MRNSILTKISRAKRAFYARIMSAFLKPRPDGHVLMLHCGRSGSTLLGDMLDQHPDVFWDGEVVEKLLHKTSQKESVGIDHLQGEFSLEDIVNRIANRIRTRSAGRIYGIEIQDYHMDFINCSVEDFLINIKEMGFSKFIYLDRHPIRKMISHLVATQNNEWHINRNQRASRSKIHIVHDRIYIGHRFTTVKESLDQMIKFKEKSIQFLGADHILKLDYDTDIKFDPMEALSKVCAHLEIPENKPKLKFAKTADLQLSDLVENYSEVESALLRSGHLAEGDSLNAY